MTAALGATALLAVWERGRRQRTADRALTLLAAASPGVAGAELLELPVGERNARLLRVRAETLGDTLAALARCEGCGAEVELAIASAEILGASRDQPQPRVHEIDVDGRSIRFRLPSAGDLVAIGHSADVEEARTMLLARCLADGSGDDFSAPIDVLPDVADAIAAHVMAVDPLVEILLGVQCPTCGQRWTMPFDVADFFWAELAATARRLIIEVHELATAYGWREADILAMSAMRRHSYLELLGV